MTTLRIACLGLVTTLTLTVGATSRAQIPRPTPVAIPGPIRVASVIPKIDVTTYGAKAVVGFDNAPAFQAAHDALAKMLASATVGQRGSLYIPPALGAYDLASPVYIDAPGIVVESDGGGATLRSGMLSANGVTFVGCPALAVGYRRPQNVGGAYAANFASYRPDLFGKVDTSLASAAGQRWGFRTNSNAFVMAHGSPFSHGGMSPSLGAPYPDCWAETKTLTIEYAVEGFAGGLIPLQTPLFGACDPNINNTYPAACRIDGNQQHRLIFQTQAARFGPAVTTQASMNQAPGVQRVAWHVDLVKGVVVGWVNGVQQFTGTCPIGGNLRESEDYPFVVGGAGISEPWLTPSSDFAVYGLSMSKTLRYKAGTNGSAQNRASDGVRYSGILDVYRYSDDGSDRVNNAGPGTGSVGYFAFTEPPAVGSPLISIPCGSSGNFAAPAFIGSLPQFALGGIGPFELRHLNVRGVRPYGTPLLVGEVLTLTVRDCQFSGGMWAVANIPMTSNYTLIFDRCSFSSPGDAAVYLYFATARFRDMNIPQGGRATLRFRESNVVVDGMFAQGATPNCQFSVARYHAGYNGGQVSIKNVLQDIEGAPTPSRGVFGLERGPAFGGSTIRLTDVLAGLAPGVPLLWLDAGAPGQNWPPNTVALDNATAWGTSAQAVANGPGWTVNAVNGGGVVPVAAGRAR
jgi:hypothetical protein